MKLSSFMQGILITAGNAIIVIGVLFWSGRVTEKTLYDKYAIGFESISIAVSDEQKAVQFYAEVLNFTPLIESKGSIRRHVVGFELPGKKRLYFHEKKLRESDAQSAGSAVYAGSALIIQVKNGFDAFHQALVSRSGRPPLELEERDFLTASKPGRISVVFQGSYGEQFVASDPDGNLVLFYRGRKIRV